MTVVIFHLSGFGPGSAESQAYEYGKLIVSDMVKKQVLADQTKVAPVRPI